MKYLRNNFHLKRIFAFTLALLISTTLMITIKPAFSSEGTVIDPILYAAHDYAHTWVDKSATSMVEAIVGSFDPSFFTYFKLSDEEVLKNPTAYEELQKGDATVYKNNYIIGIIVTFTERVGIVLATVLAMFSLLMCVVGRSEQIRDTPTGIFIKYVIAMVLIFFAWHISFYVMTIIGDLWSNFVMTYNQEPVTYAAFQQNLTVDTNSSVVTILGTTIDCALSVIDVILFWFLCIFLLWKLLKQFLRLYVEIAERYFVVTMMLFFSPTVLATIVTNGTMNIMSSYIRMFTSQAFLLLMNGIFMKIFVSVLMLGGWTGTIFNYICALAFMKFCMKLDSYMLSMGLNVAQTGGGFMDSVGGGLNTLVNAARSLGMANNNVSNHGKALMAKGASTNNKELFDKGVTLSQGLKGLSPNSRIKSSDSQFSKAVADAPTSVNTRLGETFKTNGTIEGLNATANNINIPSTSLATAINSLGKQGISPEQISSIKQLNGTTQFSNTAGNSFALQDGDGNNLAVINGSNVYTNSNFSKDLKNYDSNNTVADFAGQNTFNDIGIKTENVFRQTATEKKNGFGKQHYVVCPKGQDNAELWEATMVSQHPEALSDKNAILTYNAIGDAISLKKISSQATNNENL